MFVGREKERKWLIDALNDDESSFFAVYGRRRVGKTFLINNVYDGMFLFKTAGLAPNKEDPTSSNFEAQLAHFGYDLSRYGYPLDEPLSNWMQAFGCLEKLVRSSDNAKKVIFLDELAWMDTPQSGFLTALESFWNDWMSGRKDVILIVAASAASWLLNKIIHNKGGLHNRLRRSIYLAPFTLKECEEYARKKALGLNKRHILDLYMVFGGIPLYWDKLERGLSPEQNIDALLFKKDGSLHNEFDSLYDSLFRYSRSYKKIVEALALKRKGLTRDELAKTTGFSDGGNLSVKLSNLEACGIIRSYHAFGKSTQDALYQLIDNFTIFYFEFMHPMPNDEHFFENLSFKAASNTWKGLSFERVCLQHMEAIRFALGIFGVSNDVCSWVKKGDKKKGIEGAQIDLIVARKDDVIDIIECKYSTRPYLVTESISEGWQDRAELFREETGTNSAIHLVLITPMGLNEKSYVGATKVLNLKDLFAV